MPAADAVPQVTEIHGYFAGHAVPATAAAAQMAAAAAAQHAHVNSDVQPQVTEMHGVFGASAGTAAEAQLAAAAAGHGHAHDFGGPAAAAASGAAGATGSTIGDGRLPPLPHVHSSRGYPAVQQRTANAAAAAAAGTSRVGQTAGGSPGMAMTPLVAGYHGISRIGSTRNMQAPRSASAEAPQAAVHGRASHSPPAVNFDPVEQAITVESGAAGQLAEGNGHVMPEAGASLPIHQQQEHYDCSTLHTRAADARPADDAVADYDRALPCGSEPVSHQHSEQQQQQQYPASPGDAQIQGNSQLGQQDGSRGSPPLGMGRVGSVPPHNPGRANGGEAGVVQQQSPLCARRTLDEDAGELMMLNPEDPLVFLCTIPCLVCSVLLGVPFSCCCGRVVYFLLTKLLIADGGSPGLASVLVLVQEAITKWLMKASSCSLLNRRQMGRYMHHRGSCSSKQQRASLVLPRHPSSSDAGTCLGVLQLLIVLRAGAITLPCLSSALNRRSSTGSSSKVLCMRELVRLGGGLPACASAMGRQMAVLQLA